MMAAAVTLLLAACGGEEAADAPAAPADESRADAVLSNGMTVKQAIEARQQGFKNLGRTFKGLNDELKKGEPDAAVVTAAVATLNELSEDLPSWFPAGTGPDAGVETEALAVIWEDPEGFATKVEDFQKAVDVMEAALSEGGLEQISAASARPIGAACGSCHKKYRLDDD